jgi:HSP20 family protein
VSDRDLFANFDRMRREMDELFGGVLERTGMARGQGGFSPAIDVAYVSEPPKAVVTVELAGADPEQLDIEVHGRQLTLSGLRPAAPLENCVYQQVEIERGRFRRIVSLGAEVDPDAVTASYEAGMLRIELPLLARRAGATAVPIESRPPQ